MENLYQAEKYFEKTLKKVNKGGTTLYEVRSLPINSINAIKGVLDKVPSNTVIWQHLKKQHIVAMYIEKGTGLNYNRTFYELIHRGINTVEKFRKLWLLENGNSSLGEIPHPKSSSFTSNSRRKLDPLIIRNSKIEQKSKYIMGSLPQNNVDRTHLIPFSAIGIENNPAVVIDYDSWLNRNPMEKFEHYILQYNRQNSIYWITSVYKNAKGLNVKYFIYDPFTGVLLKQAHWIDDRWTYQWKKYCSIRM